MKTLQEIKQTARKGDYSRVAEVVKVSKDLVSKVVNELRTDHYNIQKTFSDLLDNRERLEIREAKRQEKKRLRTKQAA
jgi:hypothetical protein